MWFGVDVNQGKRAVVLDLKTEAGKAALARLVEGADVVLHNFLDRSARSLGIAHDQLAAIDPAIVSAQIGAWTGMEPGPWDNDPSFDPVLQAASGIMARYGDGPGKPVMHAIASCVDYITGFSTAAGIAQALLARERGQGGSYIRTSLAMAAQLVQFPYMVAWDGAGSGSGAVRPASEGRGPRAAHLRDGRRMGLHRLPPRRRRSARPSGRGGGRGGGRSGGRLGRRDRGCRARTRDRGDPGAARGDSRRRGGSASDSCGDPRRPHGGSGGSGGSALQLDEQRLHLPPPRPASLRPHHHPAPPDLGASRSGGRAAPRPGSLARRPHRRSAGRGGAFGRRRSKVSCAAAPPGTAGRSCRATCQRDESRRTPLFMRTAGRRYGPVRTAYRSGLRFGRRDRRGGFQTLPYTGSNQRDPRLQGTDAGGEMRS